jgi:ABC-2 type transport system permease protein
MRIVWLTAGHELRRTLRRRSFWLTTFLLPAIVLLMVFIPQMLSGGQGTGSLFTPDAKTGPIGYVDETGFVGTPPGGLPAGMVHRYQTEAQAQEALRGGQVDRYYLIPADYVASGELTVVERDYQPLRAMDNTALISYVINTGITGDERLAGLLLDPTPAIESSAIEPADVAATAGGNARSLLPYLLMFVLYLALALTSGFMLQSVTREKENRTAELLIVSVKPRDLMLGKIAGLSAVGLLQVIIWLGVVFGVLATQGTLAGMHLEITREYAAQVIPWALAYFLLGYLMYASAYAVLGVLARTTRDANQFVYLAILPLIVPLLLNSVFSTNPNGIAATVMSLLPLTSPIAMVARQGATFVPWWQSLAGLLALGIFAYFFVLVAARRFQAENLLSTRTLSLQRMRIELLPSFSERLTRGGGIVTSGGPAETDRRKPAGRLSRQRFYGLMVAAGALLVYGVVKRTGGDGSGLVFAAWGAALAAIVIYRYRKG